MVSGNSSLERNGWSDTDPDALFQQALALRRTGDVGKAIEIYSILNKWIPNHPKILLCLGEAKTLQGACVESLRVFDKVIRLSPTNALAHNLRGNALMRLCRGDEAARSFQRAIQLDPNLAEAHNNLGVFYLESGDAPAAQKCFEHAIEIREEFAEAYNNLGNALREQRRASEALPYYQKAIAYREKYGDAYYNAGLSFLSVGNVLGARECFYQAISFGTESDYQLGTYLHTKMQLCEWDDYRPMLSRIIAGTLNGEKVCVPFEAHALIADEAILQKSAEIYAKQYVSQGCVAFVAAKPSGQGSDKIRIGYISADFGDHPVTHLLAGVFDKHDRERFEVVGVSLVTRHGPWRDRVSSGFDRFLDVQEKSDQDAVTLIRDLKLDIAVDLNGYTQHCRPVLFAQRVAPIQLSYVGFLGTMGAPFVDYLVADEVVIPEKARAFYAEKLAYLPCYQGNDDQTRIADGSVYSRLDMGLPEHGVVYCSFNNNYKITPDSFDVWANILRRVPGSVLWLFASNETAKTNLRKEAELRGIASQRIIFAKRLPLEQHLARHRLADLFLDTFPYNAGATASSALRAGLPVLTLMGETFPGRYGASLLGGVGIPELIAPTLEFYEDMAVRLGHDPAALSALRDKLAANLPTAPLFDTVAFTRNIEAAYLKMVERHRAGLAPDNIFV